MRIFLPISLLLVAASPSLAQSTIDRGERAAEASTQFRLLAGTEYSEGEVGEDQEYETTSASFGVAVTNGRFTASALLPYISTSAPEELIISRGGILGTPLLASSGSQTTKVRREGVGDVVLNAGYLLPIAGVDASIAGAVKVPSASRQDGLGTGEVDYGISGQLSTKIGAVIPFVAGGFNIVGEPEGFDLNNTVSASAGGHFVLGKNLSVTASYSFEQSASAQIGDSQKLGLGLTARLADTVFVGLDGSAGLSEDAPDARVGVRIGIGL